MDNKITNPEISLQDLQNIMVIIDLACSRGAIRAAELTTVGQLYDKIQNFVKQNVTPLSQETENNV